MAREVFVVAVLAVLAAVSFGARRTAATDGTPAAAEAPPPAAAAAAPAAPARGAVAPVAKEQAPADRSRHLELPDGTFVPALNGAVDPAPLRQYWGTMPWSPIVGVERNDQGIDWYRHENGSYSTTQMVWRSDLQRYAPMTRVGHPGPATTPPVGR